MTPIRRASVLSCGGLAAVAVLAAVFRGPLLEPLIVRALQRTLGLHATIEQVGGSIFTGLDIRGIKARGDEGGGRIASFEAEQVGARYSLAALLRGKKAFLDTLEVAVAGAHLDLDLTRPPLAAKQAESPPGLPTLPRLTVRDSQLRLKAAGSEVRAAGLQGAVARAGEGGEQAVEIRADRFSLRHPALREGTFAAAITGSYAPRRLTISSAEVNGKPLAERARLDLGDRPGDFELQLNLRLWQGVIQFGMLRRAADTEVRWEAQGVELRPDLLLASEALGALRGTLSTKGSAKIGGEGLPSLAGTLSLDWKGALLAGRAVDHLVIEASAEPGTVHVENAEGRIGPNGVRLQRVVLPAPALFAGRWRALLAEGSGNFSAALGDVPAFLAFWGVRTGDGSVRIPAHLLRLEGEVEKGDIRVTRGDFASGPGRAALEGVTVSLPREGQVWAEAAFAGGATIDIPRLQEVSALFPMPPLGGSLRGRITGKGSFARPEGSASLTGRGIKVAGRAIGDVDLKARGAAGLIEIDALDVRQGGNRLTVKDARFSPAALAAPGRRGFFESFAGSFDLSCTDLPSLAVLAGIPHEKMSPVPVRHLLAAAGAVNGRTITFTKGAFTAAGGKITLRSGRVTIPVPVTDWMKGTTLESELEADLPDLGPVAAIFGLPPMQGALRGHVVISGSAGDPVGTLAASGSGIAVQGRHVGDVTVKVSARQGLVKVEALELTRGSDRLRGHGAYDIAKGTLSGIEAELSVADVAPWLAEFAPATFRTMPKKIPLSGRLRLSLRAEGPLPGSPIAIEAEISDGSVQDVRAIRGNARAHLSLDGPLHHLRVGSATLGAQFDAEAGGRTGRVSLDATYGQGELRIRALEAAGSGGLTLHGEGTLPVDLAAGGLLGAGMLSFRARVSMPHLEDVSFLFPPAYRLAGSLGADVVATGTWREPQVRMEFNGERLELPTGKRFAPPGPYTLGGIFVWSATEVRAERFRLESPALACSLSGAWTSPPPLLPLSSLKAGPLSGSLSLRASLSSPDIGWLRGSLEGVRGLRGKLAAEIVVEGPANEALFSGVVRIDEGAFQFKDSPPVDAVTVRAAVAKRRVTIEELGGNIGGSPFTLTGSVDLTRLEDPLLDLRLKGTNALLYRAEGLRVRADSDLTLRGPVSALALSGEVALTDSVYQRTLSVTDLFSGGGRKEKSAKRPAAGFAGISFPEPPLRDLRLDVRLTAREPFRILTTVVRGTAHPDVRLTGTGLLPLLRGSINFGTTQVVLPSGILEFDRGSAFLHESELSRTQLDFSGSMQALGYGITAQIGGTLGEPEIILASLPPLPNEELVLFLLTGAPPAGVRAGDSDSLTSMATPMAVYLGKGVLDELLGAGSRSGGTDLQQRLEVQVGREMTKSGSTTVDARLLLKRNLLGRGNWLYLTGEKDIYDQENFGLRVVFKFR